MNNFNAKTRYALLAALDLAAHRGSNKPVKIREIAARTATPAKYLVHILLQLKRKALVNSMRGPNGGYWLLRPPELISVAEVISAVEKRRKGSRSGVTADAAGQVINQLWADAERKRREFLSHITLAQLLGAGSAD